MSKAKRTLYTDDDIEKLIALRGDGLSEKQIALELGRPYNSVHCKIKELRKKGILPIVRDITPISEDDLVGLSEKHGVSVVLVEGVVEAVGSKLRTKLPLVDEALLMLNATSGTCAYFGVPISLEASVTSPTRAVLTTDNKGRPMWISKMAARMRRQLSHEMFVKSIVTIYENIFTRGK